MKNDWINACLELAAEPSDMYTGARKIIRNRSVTFKRIRDDLQLADAGYTKSKMTMLVKNYMHEESIAVAIDLWNKRVGQRKYGSVSFTCFAHFVKGGAVDAKRSRIASVFGPCIQSVCLTYLNNHKTHVDVFYRTTELFKKFPADLVFIRDVLLRHFDFSAAPIEGVTFHFANITLHPMYFVTLIPMLDDPIGELEELRKADEYFFNWVVKWTAKYIVPDRLVGIVKYAQAMRVHEDANKRIPKKMLATLQRYLDDNYPKSRGHDEPDDGDDE